MDLTFGGNKVDQKKTISFYQLVNRSPVNRLGKLSKGRISKGRNSRFSKGRNYSKTNQKVKTHVFK
jgi:hypothetical protein